MGAHNVTLKHIETGLYAHQMKHYLLYKKGKLLSRPRMEYIRYACNFKCGPLSFYAALKLPRIKKFKQEVFPFWAQCKFCTYFVSRISIVTNS